MNHRVTSFLVASLSALAFPSAPTFAQCGEGIGFWHAPPGLAADFGSPVGILGVYRPGNGEVIVPETDVPAANLACPVGVTCLVNNPADRRSIKDFERYVSDGNLHYALAFTSFEQDEVLQTYIPSAAALEAELAAQLLLGFHLADFETFTDSGSRRWAALFQEGGADQQLNLNMTASEIETRVEGTPPHGVLPHLVDFELLNFSFGPQRYAGLFDNGSAEQQFFPNLSVADFHETAHDLRLDGYYLLDVETWTTPTGDIRFAALFEEGSGNDHLYVMACGRNHFECNDPFFIDLLGQHLVGRTAKIVDVDPSLRLIDLEYSRSNEETFIGSFGEGAPALRSRQQGEPVTTLFDLPIATVPPTCNHAGILHDTGTDGPP